MIVKLSSNIAIVVKSFFMCDKNKTHSAMVDVKDSNSTQLQCSRCPKQYKYESERIRHEQSHYTRFECSICSKNFSFQSALRRHQKQHERSGSVKCEECGRKFRDGMLLKRHMNYAHKGTYICEKCKVSFNSEPALRTHMKIHKPESERRFQCRYDGCGKKFNFPHHLKHHELTHTNEKQHFCTICEKGFIQSHHLKTHLKTHDPENWLHCTVSQCKKKFANEYARKRHLASHKRKSDSGMSSDSNSICDVSEKSNVDNETFICSNCGGKFSQSQYTLHTSECDGRVMDFNNTPVYPVAIIKLEIEIEECPPYKTQINNESSCESVLGKCIMDDTNDGDCLCAQMTNNSDENNDITPIEDTTTNENELKTIDRNQSKCEGCECASICRVKNSQDNNSCMKAKSNYVVPEMEYRSDGAVKIKEAFDIDFGDTGENTIVNEKYAMSVPYNSCKTILGNCIVSGNGTIGEGCLCARMNIDEQQEMAEDMEDIIPHPNDPKMKCFVAN